MAHISHVVNFARSYLTPAGRQAVWNLTWMLAGRITSQVCLVVVILLLTRALGQQRFGIFATALAIQGYIVLLGAAGMPAVIVREAVRRPHQRSEIASTFLGVAWLIGLLGAAALGVTVFFLDISPAERLLLIAMCLGAAVASGNPQPLFDALHRQAFPSLTLAAGDVLLLAGIALLWLAGGVSLPAIGLLFSLKWLATVAVMVLCVRRWVPLAVASVHWAEAARLVGDG